MINDVTVLQLMTKRENYEKFSKFISRSALTKEAITVLDDIGEYFNSHGMENEISDSTRFSTYFNQVRHIDMDKDQREFYQTVILDKLTDPISTTGEEVIRHYNKLEVFDKIIEVVKKNGSIEAIEDLVSKTKRTVNIDKLEASMNLEEIRNEPTREGGLRWRMQGLQNSLGGVLIGDSIVVAGVPNTGKTAFVVSEVTHMAQYMPKDKCVLWFNNEGPEYEIRNRIYQAALNKTYKELISDISESKRAYTELMGGNLHKIKLYRAARLTYKEIERIIMNHGDSVGLIVIDMLDKVHGFMARAGSETSDEKYGRAYTWASELAIMRAPVIGTSQTCDLKKSDGTVDTIRCRYPNLEDLKGSRVAKQGDIRIAIMIGKDGGDEGYVCNRFISSPKNKVGANVKLETTFDKERNRYGN